MKRALDIGDRIKLMGGYDYDPLYLKNPPSDRRMGRVINFITGQNNDRAVVVKLDVMIKGNKIIGDIVVLELRYEGQTWEEPGPVNIELCNFIPEDKPWKDRKQGEWIEAAATLKVLHWKHLFRLLRG